MPPTRTSSAAADSTVSTEMLPTFDGSQVALASWHRELRRFEHLLSPDLAYWVVTGAANTAAGKTAVMSAHHAHLLINNLMEAQDFNVVNPPPISNKFVQLYHAMRAVGGANTPLPDNPTFSAAISAQSQSASTPTQTSPPRFQTSGAANLSVLTPSPSTT